MSKWLGAVVAVLALGAAFTYAFWPRSAPKGAGTHPGWSYSPPPSQVSFPPQKPLSAFEPKLADRSRPVSIVIFSDSTGVEIPGWVGLLGTWIGTHYHRPVIQHVWKQQIDAYVSTTIPDYAGGHGKPVTIWNAAAGGRDIPYVDVRLSGMFDVTNPSCRSLAREGWPADRDQVGMEKQGPPHRSISATESVSPRIRRCAASGGFAQRRSGGCGPPAFG